MEYLFKRIHHLLPVITLMLSHPLEMELLSLSSPDPLVAEAEESAAAADEEAHASYMAC